MRDHLKLPVNLLEGPLLNIFWMYFHRQHQEGRVSTSMWAAASFKPGDVEIAKTIKPMLQQSYEEHWAKAKIHSKGRIEGEDPVVRICAELRRTVERHLAVYGAMLPSHSVVNGYLHHERLNGTRDERLWGQLITTLVAQQAPTLALPGPIKMGQGMFGRGTYQPLKLDEEFWEELWVRYMYKDGYCPFPEEMKRAMAKYSVQNIQEKCKDGFLHTLETMKNALPSTIKDTPMALPHVLRNIIDKMGSEPDDDSIPGPKLYPSPKPTLS
jgi:hypothetical protein